MSLSLTPDKLARTLDMVLSWRGRRAATKRQLQSLIGHLSHAAFVVAPGRAFLRRMIDLMKVARQPDHHIRLTADFKSDPCSGGHPSCPAGMVDQSCQTPCQPTWSPRMCRARGDAGQCQTQVATFSCSGLSRGRR